MTSRTAKAVFPITFSACWLAYDVAPAYVRQKRLSAGRGSNPRLATSGPFPGYVHHCQTEYFYRQYEVTSLQCTDRGFTLNCSCNTPARDYYIHKGEVTMSRIIYIGMDVHSQSFSLCAFEPDGGSQGRYFAEVKVPAERSTSRSMSKGLRKSSEDSCRFVTGYEAGCLGFSLYNALVSMNVECVILAPSTMLCPRGGKRIKTDRRDARNIAGASLTAGIRRCMCLRNRTPQ